MIEEENFIKNKGKAKNSLELIQCLIINLRADQPLHHELILCDEISFHTFCFPTMLQQEEISFIFVTIEE